MANTANFSVRIDRDIEKEDVHMEQPNEKTIATMLEAKRIARDPSVKGYSDVNEVLKTLKK